MVIIFCCFAQFKSFNLLTEKVFNLFDCIQGIPAPGWPGLCWTAAAAGCILMKFLAITSLSARNTHFSATVKINRK